MPHAMSAWISLKDTQPEDGQMIVFMCGNLMETGCGRCMKDGEGIYVPSRPLWMGPITYWMPVPQSPKMETVEKDRINYQIGRN